MFVDTYIYVATSVDDTNWTKILNKAVVTEIKILSVYVVDAIC